VAVPALGRPSFQEAEAIVGPWNHLDLSHAARSSEPNTLLICENIFTAGSRVRERDTMAKLAYSSRTIQGRRRMKRLPSAINDSARLAVCTTVFLFCALPAWASDAQASPDTNAAEQTSNSAPSKSEAAPSTEDKTKKSGKYDVDRIGQRGIGKGVNIYSQQKERALGEAMAAAIDRRTKFVADSDLNDYVNRLGQKIGRNSDADVPFIVKVIDSSDLRAFALPGGFLYVDKGLIMEVDCEAELAGLMAHEVAHVAARHASRSATRRQIWNMLSIPLVYLGGPAGLGIKQVVGMGVPLTFKKFDRDAEIEADLLGIEYQYAAGYDPQAYLEALEKLQSKENQRRARMSTVPIFNLLNKVPLHDQIARAYANFPSTDERIQRLQKEISTLLPTKNDYILDTSEFEEVKAKLAWADRPILRRHRPGDVVANGPVLRRHPTQDLEQ
jgi:Zn-dependent protease with chaperone function